MHPGARVLFSAGSCQAQRAIPVVVMEIMLPESAARYQARMERAGEGQVS